MTRALTFLVVDSDPRSRFLVCSELLSAFDGSQVIEAGTATETTEKARGVHPDAVIIEQNLLFTDGIALVAGLRDLGCREPLLLLTGSRDPEIQRRALAAGADAVFLNWDPDYVGFLRGRFEPDVA